jgi:hypothetical protein
MKKIITIIVIVAIALTFFLTFTSCNKEEVYNKSTTIKTEQNGWYNLKKIYQGKHYLVLNSSMKYIKISDYATIGKVIVFSFKDYFGDNYLFKFYPQDIRIHLDDSITKPYLIIDNYDYMIKLPTKEDYYKYTETSYHSKDLYISKKDLPIYNYYVYIH